MDWRENKLPRLMVKSSLGGNCRIRFINGLQLSDATKLALATGENSNQFYQVSTVKEVLVFEKANLKGIMIAPTSGCDFNTNPGQICTFIAM